MNRQKLVSSKVILGQRAENLPTNQMNKTLRKIAPNIMQKFFTYILASRPRGELYVGATSDLARRLSAHRDGSGSRFTKRYGVYKLIYFERFFDPSRAIQRETSLKRWRRAWKIEMIEKGNLGW